MSSTWLHQIDPIAISIGPLDVRWYGLMYLAAAGAAFGLAWLRTRPPQPAGAIQRSEIEDIIFYGMVGAVLGGRLGSVIFYHFDSFLADPSMLIRVWEGGMSFHGGLLGVLAAMAWYARRRGRPVFQLYDFLAPLAPIGLGLGRLGNFIGGELWGRHTDGSWGVIFPNALGHLGLSAEQLQAQYLAGALDVEARHPSQLYQAAWEGVVLFAILWWYTRKPRPMMAASGLFLIVYAIGRIGIEFVREPDANLGYLAFGWLTMGQVLSMPMLLAGVGLMWLAARRARG